METRAPEIPATQPPDSVFGPFSPGAARTEESAPSSTRAAGATVSAGRLAIATMVSFAPMTAVWTFLGAVSTCPITASVRPTPPAGRGSASAANPAAGFVSTAALTPILQGPQECDNNLCTLDFCQRENCITSFKCNDGNECLYHRHLRSERRDLRTHQQHQPLRRRTSVHVGRRVQRRRLPGAIPELR